MFIIVPLEDEKSPELMTALQNSGYAPIEVESGDDLLEALGLEPVSMDDFDEKKYDDWEKMAGLPSRQKEVIAKALADIARTLARGIPPIA